MSEGIERSGLVWPACWMTQRIEWLTQRHDTTLSESHRAAVAAHKKLGAIACHQLVRRAESERTSFSFVCGSRDDSRTNEWLSCLSDESADFQIRMGYRICLYSSGLTKLVSSLRFTAEQALMPTAFSEPEASRAWLASICAATNTLQFCVFATHCCRCCCCGSPCLLLTSSCWILMKPRGSLYPDPVRLTLKAIQLWSYCPCG